MTAPVPGETRTDDLRVKVTRAGNLLVWKRFNGVWHYLFVGDRSDPPDDAKHVVLVDPPEPPPRIGELVGQDRAHLIGHGWVFTTWSGNLVGRWPVVLMDAAWPVRVLDHGPDTPDDAWGPG